MIQVIFEVNSIRILVFYFIFLTLFSRLKYITIFFTIYSRLYFFIYFFYISSYINKINLFDVVM